MEYRLDPVIYDTKCTAALSEIIPIYWLLLPLCSRNVVKRALSKGSHMHRPR
jgi:hypothetical protein